MSTVEPHMYELQLSHYRQIFDNSIDVIYMVEVTDNNEFIYVDVNTAYTKVTGIPREDVIGLNVDKIKDDTFRSILIEKFTLCLNAGEKTDYINDYPFPSGIMTFHSTLSPIRDESGRIHRIVGVARDITEIKKNEEKLIKLKTQLTSLISTIPDLIWVKDINGVYLACNPALEHFYGVPKSEIIGKTDYDFFHMDAADICKQSDLQAIASGTVTISQETFIYPDTGTNGIWEIRKFPVSMPNEESLGVLGIARDITESKKMEAQVSSSHNFLNQLIDSISDPIFVKDKQHNWILLNEAFCKLIGQPRELLLGKSDYDFFPRAQADVFWEKDEVVFNSHEINVNEEAFSAVDSTHYIQTVKSIFISANNDEYLVGVIRDITERKEQEELLAEKEREFRSLAENTPDNIARWDCDGHYLYINPIHERTLGKSLADVLGTFIPDSHEAVKAAIAQVAVTGEKMMVQQSAPNEKGEIEFHDVNIVAEKDLSGKIISVLGIGRDITERKQQEELLAEKERKFRSLAENSPDHIIRYDQELRVLYLNPKLESFLGISSEDVIGKIATEIFTDKHYVELAKTIRQAFIDGNPTTFDITFPPTKESGEVFHHMSITPEKDASGHISSILLIGFDITKRKKQEELLAAKEREFHALVDSSPGMMGSFYLRPDGSTCMPYVSPNIIDLFGLAPEDVADDNSALFKLHHPDDNDRIFETIAQSARTMSVWHQEFRIIHPAKGERWMESNTMPQPHPQGGTIWYGYIHDITERKKMESEIAKQKDFQNTLLLSIAEAGLGIHVIENGQYIYTNDIEKAKKYGYDETIMDVKPNFLDTIHPDDRAKALDMYTRRLAGEDVPSTYELGVVQTDGEKIEHSVSVIVIPNTDPLQSIVVTQDISARKKMEKLILQNESRLKEAQKIAKIGSWELQFPSLELSWSDEIYRIFEIIPNDEAPKYTEFISVIHPDDRDLVDLAYERSLNNKIPYEVTHRLRMNDGRIKYVHEKGTTFYDTQGNPLRSIGTAQDVTEQKMFEKKIEYMAHHDALTGLPNRILSKARSEQAIAYAKSKNSKMAFLFIDLDGFKNINDSMGHSAGDSMLKIVAERLREIVKVSDTISRQGGDEFLITLSDVNDRGDIVAIADRLLKEFEQSFYIHEQVLSISASIGIAVYPENGDTFEALLQNADAAMYAAKASGKNAYSFYTKQMSNNLIKQFKIQNDLKSALENNEFILHYQPQIDLAQNQITGAEALIRWNHPQLGMIPPLNFIPIAESSGMIVPIGEWVIIEACRQCALWHSQGLEITIAVNISAVQFKRGNLETIIKNALTSSGLNPEFLELELTESILIHDSENILLAVHALKALGIKLSIDDFGTGYSSLSYLKRFAVDKLKIDQSFVKDILRDQEDAAIVQTIIQMAKNLNLKTIAEGVEDKNVLAVIESYGCDEVQGYHFAKPMEASDFKKYHDDFVNQKVPKGDLCQS